MKNWKKESDVYRKALIIIFAETMCKQDISALDFAKKINLIAGEGLKKNWDWLVRNDR